MLFRQLFDETTSTYTYLLADPDTREAVIIDPVAEQVERDIEVIDALGLKLIYTLDTHVHADHVTGSGQLRERTGAKSVLSAAANAVCADVAVRDGDSIEFGSYSIEVRSTPGHTAGCVTYVVEDAGQTFAFTGDALLIRGCGRTDFQQGNPRTLYRSVHGQIFTLPDNTVIYPGHDYRGNSSSTVAEEQVENPRLNAGVSEEQFVDIMDNLNLPNPKLMDVAVPANMSCGLPEAELETETQGVRNVRPDELRDPAALRGYRVVDVRQPEEFNDSLGHIEGAQLVPLATLPTESANWAPDERLLVVCRSGARAGNAAQYLVENGFSNVSNLSGGMVAWNQCCDSTASAGQS